MAHVGERKELERALLAEHWTVLASFSERSLMPRGHCPKKRLPNPGLLRIAWEPTSQSTLYDPSLIIRQSWILRELRFSGATVHDMQLWHSLST